MERFALRVFVRGGAACGLILFAYQAQGALLNCPDSSSSEGLTPVGLAIYSLTLQLDTAPSCTISKPVAPNTVASIIQSGTNSTGGSYTGRASADTGQASPTFVPVLVSVQGEVDAPAVAPISQIGLYLSSGIIYYFRVEQTAPAPVDVVPLVIDSKLHADAGATGLGGSVGPIVATFEIMDLNIFHSEAANCTPTSCTSPSEMSFTDSVSATAGQEIQVQIGAAGSASATGAQDCCTGHATFQAIADPTIQIDPSFAYADDFTLVFSSNLPTPTPAPEPPSIAMLAIGLLALMALVRSSTYSNRRLS